MSALAGDALPVTSLPSREFAATAVGNLLAILPSVFCDENVAELEDDFDPEFEDMFVTRLMVDFVIRTVAVVLTFV